MNSMSILQMSALHKPISFSDYYYWLDLSLFLLHYSKIYLTRQNETRTCNIEIVYAINTNELRALYLLGNRNP